VGDPTLPGALRACRCPSNGRVPAALPRGWRLVVFTLHSLRAMSIDCKTFGSPMTPVGFMDPLRDRHRPPRGLGKTSPSLALSTCAQRRSHVRCGSFPGCLTWSREVVHGINCSGRRNRRPGQSYRPRTPRSQSSFTQCRTPRGVDRVRYLDCQNRGVANTAPEGTSFTC